MEPGAVVILRETRVQFEAMRGDCNRPVMVVCKKNSEGFGHETSSRGQVPSVAQNAGKNKFL